MKAIFILHRKRVFLNLLLIKYYSTILWNFYGYYYNEGGFTIQEKVYYNQKYIINEIHNRTGYSINDIAKILNILGEVIMDKFSDKDDYVEIKLFPGLKISSQYILPEQSKSNLDISNLNFILRLNAIFSDRFKKNVRILHDNIS